MKAMMTAMVMVKATVMVVMAMVRMVMVMVAWSTFSLGGLPLVLLGEHVVQRPRLQLRDVP